MTSPFFGGLLKRSTPIYFIPSRCPRFRNGGGDLTRIYSHLSVLNNSGFPLHFPPFSRPGEQSDRGAGLLIEPPDQRSVLHPFRGFLSPVLQALSGRVLLLIPTDDRAPLCKVDLKLISITKPLAVVNCGRVRPGPCDLFFF